MADRSDDMTATPSPSGLDAVGQVTSGPLDEALAGLREVAADAYRLGPELARGRTGRIVEAYDLRHGRPVAIKMLLRDQPGAQARFAREARITARLQHPAIVPVYEAGRWTGGEPFFAMKLVRGRPLDRIIAGTGALAERMALLPTLIAVSEALAYA